MQNILYINYIYIPTNIIIPDITIEVLTQLY